MDDITLELFNEVRRIYSEKRTLTDDLLRALQFTFQSSLILALDLVDRGSVTLLSSPSGRQVFRVMGSSGIPYICLVGLEYCECPAYRYSVLKNGDALLCKHVLAAKLSEAMQTHNVQTVTDEQLSALINAMN